jgi:hypothetical protein
MSAYRKQLIDARSSTAIQNVAGKCSDTAQFADLVNRATAKLIKRGAWFGTEVLARFCVYGCRVVWPRYVSTVLGARFCKFGEIEIKNNWYSILSWPMCNGSNWGRGGDTLVMSDGGLVPTFNEITGNSGKFLRYHVVKTNDLNKNITFFGKKYGGQPLQEQETVGGPWVNGLTLTSATPIAQTTTLVTKLTQITREATEGMTYLYQYDPVTTDLLMLGQFEPNETNPQYRSSIINGIRAIPGHTDSNGRCVREIEALVKLEFIPATNDRDFLIIDDFEALALAIQSIKFAEANDPENSQKYLALAIAELNFESRNKNPSEQFVTQVNVMGSRRVVTNPI